MGKFEEPAKFRQQRENRAACDLIAIENALVELLAVESGLIVNGDLFAGLLPPSIANGIGVEITGDWPGSDLKIRNYFARLEGRDSDHNRLRRSVSKLAGLLPLRRRTAGDFLFSIVFMDSMARYDYETHASIRMGTAAFEIEFHIEVNQ